MQAPAVRSWPVMELLGVPGFRRTHLLEFPSLWMTCLALSPLGNQRAASCFGNIAEMFKVNLSKILQKQMTLSLRVD